MAWKRTSAVTLMATPEVLGATQQTLPCASRAAASNPAGRVSGAGSSWESGGQSHARPPTHWLFVSSRVCLVQWRGLPRRGGSHGVRARVPALGSPAPAPAPLRAGQVRAGGVGTQGAGLGKVQDSRGRAPCRAIGRGQTSLSPGVLFTPHYRPQIPRPRSRRQLLPES